MISPYRTCFLRRTDLCPFTVAPIPKALLVWRGEVEEDPRNSRPDLLKQASEREHLQGRTEYENQISGSKVVSCESDVSLRKFFAEQDHVRFHSRAIPSVKYL